LISCKKKREEGQDAVDWLTVLQNKKGERKGRPPAINCLWLKKKKKRRKREAGCC